MKKIVIALTVCLAALAGCANVAQDESLAEAEANTAEFRLSEPDENQDSEAGEPATDSAPVDEPEGNPSFYEELPDGRAFFDMFAEPAVMLQFQPIEPGEELVVLHTNHGDITLRLFPDEAPLSVENFLTHARDGYYDGVIFHRVIQDFMIQGGDPDGTGMGGDSIWGEPFFVKPMIFKVFGETFDDEDMLLELPSINLKHFRGALAMAHAGGSMGSQFYIVQNPHAHPHAREIMEMITMELAEFGEVPEGYILTMEEVAELYEIHGGTPHLDWWWEFGMSHIVFGHVVEGMDIVDAIAAVDVDQGQRPLEDVVIERISFVIYE